VEIFVTNVSSFAKKNLTDSVFGKYRFRPEPSVSDVEKHLGLILDRCFVGFLLHREMEDAHLWSD